MNVPRKILLVCLGNITRSRIGEEYFSRKLEERHYRVSRQRELELLDNQAAVSSAGVVASTNEGGRQFTEDLGNRADTIIAMDESIAYSLSNSFHQPKNKIISLHIIDNYDQDYEGLVRALDEQLLPYIDRWFPK